MMNANGSKTSPSNTSKYVLILLPIISVIIIGIVAALYFSSPIDSGVVDAPTIVPVEIIEPKTIPDIVSIPLSGLQNDIVAAPVLKLGEIFVDENTAMTYGDQGISNGPHVYPLSSDEVAQNAPLGFSPWGIFYTSLPVSFDEIRNTESQMYLVGKSGHADKLLEHNLSFIGGLGAVQANLPVGDTPKYVYFISTSGNSVKWNLDDVFTYDMVKIFDRKVFDRYEEISNIVYDSSMEDRVENGQISLFNSDVFTRDSFLQFFSQYDSDNLPDITDVKILSDKKTYQIGDVAKIIISVAPQTETVLQLQAFHGLKTEFDMVTTDENGMAIIEYVISDKHKIDSVVIISTSVSNPYYDVLNIDELLELSLDERKKYQSSSLSFETAFLITK